MLKLFVVLGNLFQYKLYFLKFIVMRIYNCVRGKFTVFESHHALFQDLLILSLFEKMIIWKTSKVMMFELAS